MIRSRGGGAAVELVVKLLLARPQVDHADLKGQSDLLGGQADPFGRKHRVNHVFGQALEIVVKLFDYLPFFSEDRVSVVNNFQLGHVEELSG